MLFDQRKRFFLASNIQISDSESLPWDLFSKDIIILYVNSLQNATLIPVSLKSHMLMQTLCSHSGCLLAHQTLVNIIRSNDCKRS